MTVRFLALAATSTIGTCLFALWVWKLRSRRKQGKAKFGREIREQEFVISKEVSPCNNGSFGATPRPVLRARQRFVDEAEDNPDDFFVSSKAMIYYEESLLTVADFVGAKMEHLVFVQNTTTGINSVMKSFKFNKGDSVLVSSLTYPAIVNMVMDVCDNSDKELQFIKVNINFPIHGKHEVIQKYIDILEANPSIRVAIIDHITSSTALLMPIQELIQACHDRGVQVVIDGAHAPGQVQLNLEQLGADYYVGNLYKWLFAPRPSAFLWVNQKHYKTVKPLVTSHNYQQSLQNQFYQQGACDYSQYFSSEAAIQFYQDIGGYEAVSQYNREMVEWAMEMLAEAWQTECLPIPGDMRAPFMGMVALPEGCIINVPTTVSRDYTENLKEEIHNKYKISILLGYIQDRFWCRLCSHVYNSKEDYFNVRDAFLDMKMENSKIS